MQVTLTNVYDHKSQTVDRAKIASLASWSDRDIVGQVVFAKDSHGLIPAIVSIGPIGSSMPRPQWLGNTCWGRFLVQGHPKQPSGVILDMEVKSMDLHYLGRFKFEKSRALVTLVGFAESHGKLLNAFGRKDVLGGTAQVEARVEKWLEWPKMIWFHSELVAAVPPGLFRKLEEHWINRTLSGLPQPPRELVQLESHVPAFIAEATASEQEVPPAPEVFATAGDELLHLTELEAGALDAIEKANLLIKSIEKANKEITMSQFHLERLMAERRDLASGLSQLRVRLTDAEQIRFLNPAALEDSERMEYKTRSGLTFYINKTLAENICAEASTPQEALEKMVRAHFSIPALLVCNTDVQGSKDDSTLIPYCEDLMNALHSQLESYSLRLEDEPRVYSPERLEAFSHDNCQWRSVRHVLENIKGMILDQY